MTFARVVGVASVLCSSAFSFSLRLPAANRSPRLAGIDERRWGNELGDNGVGSWGGHSSVNEALAGGPFNVPVASSSASGPALSPRGRAALERTVLRTVATILEGRASGSEEFRALFSASGAGKQHDDGEADHTREDSTGPMSARVLGTLLKSVPLNEYTCTALVGLKRVYDNTGGVSRFCRDHANVVAVAELDSSTDFLVSLTPDYANALARLDEDDADLYEDEDDEDDDEEELEPLREWGVPPRTPPLHGGSSRPRFAPTAHTAAAAAVADEPLDRVVSPLKTMVFVDGTWLYYAIHERPTAQCAIKQALGANWRSTHAVQWALLPRLLAKAIEAELRVAQRIERHVEVTRTVVFTSARATTPPSSPRITMFRDMQAANMEVHMSQTEGEKEKCVDIALAVEMLHYATVPGAYDLAVLLTGDKDFMPVMTRTRQKGKRVALATMRANCNRDLLQPQSHIRDFSPIFLEHHLKDLIVPIAPGARRTASSGGMALPKDVPTLSRDKRAALELKVLATVVAVLDAHDRGPPSEGPFAALYENLSGAPGGSGSSSSSSSSEPAAFDEGPMTARVLGALLRGVQLDDFKCDALTGMKWLYDNAGGMAKFCKGHPDAFTTSPVTGTTDFFVRLVPGFAARLGLQQAALLAASLPDDGGGGDDDEGGDEGGNLRGLRSQSSQRQTTVDQGALAAALAAANRGGNEDDEDDDAAVGVEDSDDDYDFAETSGEEEPAMLPLEDLAILDDAIISRMVVPELKEWLRALQLTVSGRKPDLVNRLSDAVAAAQAQALFDPKPTGSSPALPYQDGDEAQDDDEEEEDAEYAAAAARLQAYEHTSAAFAAAVPPPAPAASARSAATAAARSSELAVESNTSPSRSRISSSSSGRGGSATEAVEADLIAAVRESVLDSPGRQSRPRRSSREVGKVLKALPVRSLGGRDASAGIKLVYGSLKAFLRLFPDAFDLEDHAPGLDGLAAKGFDIIMK